MERSPKEIFEEKVLLVYEHDKRSPLFVRTAYIEIDNNNVEKAITILRSGLKIYPKYPTALFLLGKALAIIGKYDDALEQFHEACAMIGSNDSLIYYKSEVERIKHQRSPFESKRRTTLIEDPKEEKERVIDKGYFADNQNGVSDNQRKILLEQKISEIAKHTTGFTNGVTGDFEEKLIISETFADILIAQNRYDEAITVLKELMHKNPGKIHGYLERINSISTKLS